LSDTSQVLRGLPSSPVACGQALGNSRRRLVFAFALRAPLLRQPHDALRPATLRMTALASMSMWFIVAASGRWIGFS
jgi:hypothetical protein